MNIFLRNIIRKRLRLRLRFFCNTHFKLKKIKYSFQSHQLYHFPKFLGFSTQNGWHIVKIIFF